MNITSDVKVLVRFEVTDVDGTRFNDAIYLTPEAYAATSPADLDAMKTARYQAWKTFVAAPPPIPAPPTEEDLLSDIVDLEEQRAAIDEQLAVKNAILAVVVAKADPSPIEALPPSSIAKE